MCKLTNGGGGAAWRDFYTHILALYPRVSMGRPFQEKYQDVQWETQEEHLQAWKEGRTGVPIVDAAMRQARKMGWMHNRGRMVAAMFLTKDLMIDWRLGEKGRKQERVVRHCISSEPWMSESSKLGSLVVYRLVHPPVTR